MTDYSFEGLSIERIIAHTIFARNKDKERVPPSTSDELIEMDMESKDLIQTRITEALGSKSHGIETTISKDDVGSFMQQAANIIHMPNNEFVQQSKQLAEDLTDAQTSTRWPGGVLIVISGRVGINQNKYCAVIKAETDRGFNVEEKNGVVSLTLIKKMLLSETQRLYKIGVIVEINHELPQNGRFKKDNYRSFLFDHLLTATETKNAAAYFYDAFLGMAITSSSKHQTRSFYEHTLNYINTLPEDYDKLSLLEALRSELRSNKPTLRISEFAKDHFPEDIRDDYTANLSERGLPMTAMVKDTAFITSKLRRPRNVKFSSGVKIQVPSDVNFNEHVSVEGHADGFTTVNIKGVVQERE